MSSYEPNANDLQKNTIDAMRRILDYRSSIPPESESRVAALISYIGLAVSAINFVKYASQLTTQTTSRFQVRVTNQKDFSFYIYKTHMKNVSRPKYELEPGETTLVDVSNLMTSSFKAGASLSFAYMQGDDGKTKDFTVYFNYAEPDILPFLGVEAIVGNKEYKNPYCTEPYPPQSGHPFISFWSETIDDDILIYVNHIYSDLAMTKNVTVSTLELILC